MNWDSEFACGSRGMVGMGPAGADKAGYGAMDLSKLGIFRLMRDKMSWHGQRQEVLAQNVANADTPEFRPHDLVDFDFRKEMRKAARMDLAATAPQHLTGTVPKGGDFKDAGSRSVYETAPDGNQVVLEEQMMKLGQNAVDYQTITNLYRKQMAMLRMAIGRGGGQ